DHGAHAAMAGQMDHGAHAEMAGQMDHGAHAAMAGQMDHGAHAAMAGQMDHGAHAAMAGQMDHSAHAAMAGQMDHGAHGAAASAPAPEHAWMAPPEAVATANPVKADKASVRRGETVYRANCMTCHGAQGLGDGPLAASLPTRPANLVAHLAHHTDGDYAWKIRTGRGAMPAFAGVLKDQQVWDAVNYLRSLGAAQQDSGGHAHHGH
ncbi:MAG: cytochrome c, partial [Gammaproteobacteria bacterium]|nr:cytochrome c [Gammaproteobacteria bacterium]